MNKADGVSEPGGVSKAGARRGPASGGWAPRRTVQRELRQLRHVVLKEVLQLRHDRKMIPLLLLAPIVQIVILGFAANLDVTRVPLLVVDQDRTASSRALVERFTASRNFEFAGAATDGEAIDRAFFEGTAQLALVIRSGYGSALAAGHAGEVQVVADGSDAVSAGQGLGFAAAVILAAEEESAARRAAASGAGWARGPGGPALELVPRVLYNPDLRSRWFYVPAILAMVLLLTTMVLPSMAVVREKEIGTLEQIMVTPIRPWQLIVGKLLPFAGIGLGVAAAVTGAAVWLLGVPLRGSFLLLLGLTALFLLNTLGLGLLVSTLARNQQQAMMSSIYLVMIPMIFLSGLLFPLENMPPAIRVVSWAIPLRYYATVIRGIFLKGAGLESLWSEALSLLVYGAMILAIASLRFRKRLD